MSAEPAAPDVPAVPAGAARPQALLLTLLGRHVLGRAVLVSQTSVSEVMARVGVSDPATRSVLLRMEKRGLLRRERRGRPVFLGLTPRSRELLADGQRRLWAAAAVSGHWDGAWTLLTFSLPEAWQRQRHQIRSRLQWAGFGMLQGGLWIAPSALDVGQVLAGVEGADRVRAFVARPGPDVDVPEMVRDAWDLAELRARYDEFLARWGDCGPAGAAGDALAAQLALTTDWLAVLRSDPRLPLEHLPADWPARRAQEVFRRWHAELDPPARAAAADILVTAPDLS
ncbi:PaaX family transcriptional regulator [Geodermatophilus nigrescens]|uniref:Transcriptional regulator, PaaX family n=1 Tax=Geodermatophilus nigrescens TaxID=1070870 RepID=A0A1M5HIH9_9ACTN|nr:PaaX family transcriptional regulator C-terminal domain-containing protein [Geodermatophilus nigrescens]SHG15622.1 transcriptional regulator, PaaX family [Geodermatophilus nigrescens]